MGKQAAFADAEIACKPADREAFETLDRGKLDSPLQDLTLRPFAYGPIQPSFYAFRKAIFAIFRARSIARVTSVYSNERSFEKSVSWNLQLSRFTLVAAGAALFLPLSSSSQPSYSLPDSRALESTRRPGNSDRGMARAYRFLYKDWDLAAAMRGFREAIRSDPSDPLPHVGYSESLTAAGRHAEAIAEGAEAIRLDSESASIAANYGRALLFARRYKEAATALRRALRQGEDPAARIWLAWAYDQQGKYDLAIEQHRKAIAASGAHRVMAVASLGCSLARRGDGSSARSILTALEAQGDEAAFGAALVVGPLAEIDRSFALLDRAILARNQGVPFMAANPQLDSLRKDTRFRTLVGRIHSPVERRAAWLFPRAMMAR